MFELNPHFILTSGIVLLAFVVWMSRRLSARTRLIAQELRHSREALEFALKSGRMGTWDIDLRSDVLTCSPEMLALWNLNLQEFQGDRNALQRKVHPDDLGPMLEAISRTIHDGAVYDIEYRIYPRPGEVRWVCSRGRCLYDPQTKKPIRFAGVVFDVTAQKDLEDELRRAKVEAEASNLAKSQFLANMSHEIRTPVTAIVGFAEILVRQTSDASEAAEYAQIVERNSQNLLRLIDDILNLSRIEAGKLSIESTSVPLNSFLTDIRLTMERRSIVKKIAFALETDANCPDYVQTDPVRLRQILTNLIGNAIKFTDQGRVEVRATYEREVLRFMVRDTGPGLTPEALGRIFQLFGQGDPSMTRRYGGSGLGLVLAKSLARALGGDVILESTQIGQGSTFVATILAPLALPSTAMLTSRPPKAVEKPSFSGRRILLVEDVDDNRRLISTYLAGTGVTVDVATDGLSGVRMALSLTPDLILMDIQMPGMDGHEAIRQLRSSGFERPIIALTAHAMEEERAKCFQSGCTDYLTKPLPPDKLLHTLSRFL